MTINIKSNGIFQNYELVKTKINVDLELTMNELKQNVCELFMLCALFMQKLSYMFKAVA